MHVLCARRVALPDAHLRRCEFRLPLVDSSAVHAISVLHEPSRHFSTFGARVEIHLVQPSWKCANLPWFCNVAGEHRRPTASMLHVCATRQRQRSRRVHVVGMFASALRRSAEKHRASFASSQHKHLCEAFLCVPERDVQPWQLLVDRKLRKLPCASRLLLAVSQHVETCS